MGSCYSTVNKEEGECSGVHDHPLLNQVILEVVVGYVRKRDLLACRGVCWKWNQLTIPFTRSKFAVGIQLSIGRNTEETTAGSIEDFVAVFSKNKLGIPFAKFKLGPFCTTAGIGQQFLELCGDTTTELHLCEGEEGNEVFKVEDMSEILRSMPKLERLKMSDKLVTESGNVVELFPGSKPKLSYLKSFTLHTDDDGEAQVDCCPTFLEELIMAAENISDLSIEDRHCGAPSHSDDEDEDEDEDEDKDEHEDADEDEDEDAGQAEKIIHSNIFSTLTVIEKLGRESSIQSLMIQGVSVNPHAEILRRMAAKRNGSKLKALSFLVDDDEDSDHFHLVELFKDTLEHLRELGSSYSSFLNLPKMPRLTDLDLTISTDFNSGLFDMNKNFPILKKLQLYQDDSDQVYDEFLPQSESCPNIKLLSLVGLHLKINAFGHVLTIFPRLTALTMKVTEDGAEIVRQICSRMPQLEFLSICGNLQSTDSMDSLFTGISASAETIEGITGVVKELDKTTNELRRDTIRNIRNLHCPLPSIANLTNLRGLVLSVSGDEDGSRLSDVSGFLAFYSLKHLSRLDLYKCKLTKKCCEILTMEMEVGLETWTFKTPEGKSIIPDRTY